MVDVSPSRRNTPTLQHCQAAGQLHLQHQLPLTRRPDAQRQRGVHKEWLGGVPMEIQPWLDWFDQSIELKRSIQHALGHCAVYC